MKHKKSQNIYRLNVLQSFTYMIQIVYWVYRGRLDASSPGKDIPITGIDLRTAIEALLRGDDISSDQHPSMGL